MSGMILSYQDAPTNTILNRVTYSGSGSTIAVIPDQVEYIVQNGVDHSNNYSPFTPVKTILTGVQFSSNSQLKSICNFAFTMCTVLSSLTIPPLVTNVGGGMCQYCYGLLSVTFLCPNPAIGESAFFACGLLSTVNLPSAMTSISQSTFGLCSSLASITFPTTLTTIGRSAFSNCAFTSITNFPASLTTIGFASFSDNYGLRTLVIPNNVTTLEYGAFGGCYITSLTLSENITDIPEICFQGNQLTSLTLPYGLLTMGRACFFGARITSVTIPPTVTTLAGFGSCTLLTSVFIPSSVTTIGNQAFASSPLSSVTFESASSLTTIGSEAFSGCNSLITITLPNTLETIGNYAFSSCTNLETVNIPPSIQTIGDNCFASDTKLNTVTFQTPSSLTSIRPYAFASCKINSFTLPDGLQTIGQYAFLSSKINSITIPPSVTLIDDYAFNNCILTSLVMSGTSLITIGISAFTGSPIANAVTIPSSVVTIRAGAFLGCSSGDFAFSGSSLQTIGAGAFQNTGQATITIPPSVLTIGQQAFFNCPIMNTVTFASDSIITEIPLSCFKNCPLLANITIPLSVTLITNGAFQGCTSLLVATIPQNVVFIDTNAFQGCTSLNNVIFNCRNNALTILGQNCFAGTTSINPSNNGALYYLIAKGYNVGGLDNYNLAYAGFNTEDIPNTPPNPPYVPCFNEGTKILCFNKESQEEEYMLIEKIRKGTLVKTLLHGYVPVDMIGTTKQYNPANKLSYANRLYVCTKDNYPEITEDLYITGCHAILVDKFVGDQREKTEAHFGKVYITDNKYRLLTCLDDRAIPYEKEGIFNIWHLALEHERLYPNYGIYANGLLVESCSKRFLKELSGMVLIE